MPGQEQFSEMAEHCLHLHYCLELLVLVVLAVSGQASPFFLLWDAQKPGMKSLGMRLGELCQCSAHVMMVPVSIGVSDVTALCMCNLSQEV